MIFSSALSIAAITAAGFVSAPLANALDVGQAVKRATDFTFDLFSGTNLQDDTSTKAPSDLDYTTGGGVP